MVIIKANDTADIDRRKAFCNFARQWANGEVIIHPKLLPSTARRLHIRQTLREDHRFRIHNRPEGAQAKFDKLASSPFSFFRGTALLYYRDEAGTDGHLPSVLTIGDVHPENFGVMPNENGAPFFGLNDFDEAFFAPFSWDVKRGATGFYVVAKEKGLAKKKRCKVVKAFVKGYLQGLREFVQDDREKSHQYRIDNSPGMIRELLQEAQASRKAFLEDLVALEKGQFIASKKIVPYSKHVAKFQEIIEDYIETNDINTAGRGGHFTVKDVAIKKGSGTASLGLDRYFVLIDGPSDDHTDDIILELKQSRQSALYGLVPEPPTTNADKAERIVKAHQIHLVGGDPYYGHTIIDEQSFLGRERSPFKDNIDVSDLSKKEFEKYATICGKTLAQAHARSDKDTGIMDGNAEKRILSSIKPNLFLADTVRFAQDATHRMYKDYKLFIKDHTLKAFDFVNNGS